MGTTSVFFHSHTIPFTLYVPKSQNVSQRHSIKHLPVNSSTADFNTSSTIEIKAPLLKPLRNPSSSSLRRTSRFTNPFKCSYATAPQPEFENHLTKTFKNIKNTYLISLKGTLLKLTPLTNYFTSLKDTLLQLTPLDICKWSGVVCFWIAAIKWAVGLVLNPFFWVYVSWAWVYWPWCFAIALAAYGFYCLRKHSVGEANIFEQLVILTSTFTWLTLVPPAHFNGFLQGWPYVFFFIYYYFFFFNASVRKRLYGDYFAREHDPKWDIVVPSWYRWLFGAGVLIAHFLAAFEGPELHLTPGGLSNVAIWGLIMVTLFMQYHSTLYLAKYSENVVVPTAVVQFGPYRWVRHPIYASVMLLFATYFVALRAPLSVLFVAAVCVAYYDQKAKLEEKLMIETFGKSYTDYASKVRYKFIPFVY